jgi:3-oxoacyl-[acyl-carrier-protein] synthase I
MKKPVFIVSNSVVSPLGSTIADNMEQLFLQNTAIQPAIHPEMGTVWASTFHPDKRIDINKESEYYTKIERLFINSIEQAIASINLDTKRSDVLFVFASTKGNIEQISNSNFDSDRLRIAKMASDITDYFENKNQSVVVSNACISGIQAIQYACQALQNDRYSHVIVSGADCVSDFVLAGFYSFQALSPFPCTPFDKNRAGVSIGEGCGTLLLSTTNPSGDTIEILSVVSANDANHLSGPSRTGEGLASAIVAAISDAAITPADIDVISAHGTATSYNDEMESFAFKTAGLERVPVFSTKGNIGHTLGAAGIIETIYLMHSINENRLIPSFGYKEIGTSVRLNVTTAAENRDLSIGLKTGSGFGGGNAALILKQVK